MLCVHGGTDWSWYSDSHFQGFTLTFREWLSVHSWLWMNSFLRIIYYLLFLRNIIRVVVHSVVCRYCDADWRACRLSWACVLLLRAEFVGMALCPSPSGQRCCQRESCGLECILPMSAFSFVLARHVTPRCSATSAWASGWGSLCVWCTMPGRVLSALCEHFRIEASGFGERPTQTSRMRNAADVQPAPVGRTYI